MSSWMHRLALATASAAAVMLASCGGSDEEEVQTTELAESDQAVLGGDWPLDAETSAFLIKTDAEWQQAWAERKAVLVCDSVVAPYNDAACAADSAPAIDFSTYSLVGLLIAPARVFIAPTPRRVFLEQDGHVLVVQYEYHNTYHVGFYNYTGTRFFLVPKTEAELSAQAKEV
jgi:hypothetical protein